MKKIGIIAVNLFLFIFVLIAMEAICYFKDTSGFKYRPAYIFRTTNYSIESLKMNMRHPQGLVYAKPPILIYGCSYAYGFALDEKESFGYKLSELTKRPVYNFAVSSKGLQDALFLLRNDEKVTPEPEYIFYVFINDHVRRMFVNCNKIDNVKYLTYKNVNNNLVQNTDLISDKSYLLRNLENQSYYLLKNVFKKQIFELVKLYFVSINNEIKKKYPNAKFVVIDYENGHENYLSLPKIKELEKEGIEVISLSQVFNDKLKMNKYKNPKEIDPFRHPNGQAWNLITEYFAERYRL